MKFVPIWGMVTLLLLPTWARAEIKPSVKPYHVDPTLSNVANLAEFKAAINEYSGNSFAPSDAQRRTLSQNAFVVIPGDAEQFFHIYESGHYGIRARIPNFITADSALQIYHLLYDCTLKSIEVQFLHPALSELTEGMLRGSLKHAEAYSDPILKEAALRNVVLFAVPARLLGMDETGLPPGCEDMVAREVAKIQDHANRATCAATNNGMDYTQFAVRGHYTRTPQLGAYYLSMMWYGTAGLPMEEVPEGGAGAVFQSLMITDLLFENADDPEALIRLWDKIYSITALYAGSANHLNPHDVWNAIPGFARAKSLADSFRGADGYPALLRHLKSLAGPRIVQEAAGLPVNRQFRFMSQRFVLDSYILQRLSDFPERSFPKGLDVMAVLGSIRAAKILDSEPCEWDEYVPRRDALVQEFSDYDAEWDQSLAAGWLHILQALIQERGEGYPSFMRNTAWTDKQLNTSLASWSEMRRDSILYATPSYAEGGDGDMEIRQPKGYVEPVVEFWSRLLKQVEENRRLLMAAGFLSDDVESVFERYESLIDFFKEVSVKELGNQALAPAEYERIRQYGLTIETLSLDILKTDRAMPIHQEHSEDETGEEEPITDIRDIVLDSWFQVSGPDRDVACIADVHTSRDRCLEEAVGHIDEIYVVVPMDGELHLTRGGVFSYYEFEYPAPHRLNDEAWQEMIKRRRAPKRPKWVSSFLVE